MTPFVVIVTLHSTIMTVVLRILMGMPTKATKWYVYLARIPFKRKQKKFQNYKKLKLLMEKSTSSKMSWIRVWRKKVTTKTPRRIKIYYLFLLILLIFCRKMFHFNNFFYRHSNTHSYITTNFK